MNEPEILQPLNIGIRYVTKDVKYTVITAYVCGQNIKLECAHIQHEDITEEIIMHLLKQRIAGIQKYKDINKIDLYERDKCAHWSLGRFTSIDIPDVFKDRFNDGEMLDDQSTIEKILNDFIVEYNKDDETRGCEEHHDMKCKRCHRCTYVRPIVEFTQGDDYCTSCHHEMDKVTEIGD